MKKSTTPTIKSLAMQTTARLSHKLTKTTINSFERTALLSVKTILDSYEWLLYAVGKTPDVYTTVAIQFELESALKCAEKVIHNVEMNSYTGETEMLGKASKGFTIGNIKLQLNRLKDLIERVEKINNESKSQCEKAWHEYENSCYWLHFLKKKVHETT